jgi:hypothetical protein
VLLLFLLGPFSQLPQPHAAWQLELPRVHSL